MLHCYKYCNGIHLNRNRNDYGLTMKSEKKNVDNSLPQMQIKNLQININSLPVHDNMTMNVLWICT